MVDTEVTKDNSQSNPYRAYAIGSPLNFALETVDANNHSSGVEYSTTITDIKGGGFCGRVLFLEGLPFVIKTTLPDPFHDVLRRIFWKGRDFPSRRDPLTARLDHMGLKLIHDVLPPLSQGRFRSPDSYGFMMTPTGYGQALEKLSGRGPRLNNQVELHQFQQDRNDLAELALKLGLEQAAQIDLGNSLGRANMWCGGIWLDNMPAMPHIIPWGFHKRYREHFGYKRGEASFNTIHIDQFLKTVGNNRGLFNSKGELYNDLVKRAYFYQDLLEEKNKQKKNPLDIKGFLRASVEAATEMTPKLVRKVLVDKLAGSLWMVFNKPYRERTILEGVDKACSEGLISEQEKDEAHLAFKSDDPDGIEKWKKVSALGTLPFLYFGLAGIPNTLKYGATGYFALNEGGWEKFLISAGIFTAGTAAESLFRVLETIAVEKISGVDLSVARKITAFPALGKVYAISAQVAADSAASSDTIRHYTARKIVADLSRIHPFGGWGTDVEANLWEKIGPKIEWLANRKEVKGQVILDI